jgi:hypothetical protein
MKPTPLTVALRAYAERLDVPHRSGSIFPWSKWPREILVFDTETTTDVRQKLTFGSWRHYELLKGGALRLQEQGIFYADDLPQTDPQGFKILRKYVRHESAAKNGRENQLVFQTKSEFLSDVFYRLAYQSRAFVVGFNLPFDLMRLAVSCGEGRDKFYGGFSLVLWQEWDADKAMMIENRWRPRLHLKLLDSKRAFIEFAKPLGSPDADGVEGATSKKGEYTFRGHFLDLRTLAFALTSDSLSLEKACELFGVEHGKQCAKEHGRITNDYIDYNRRDVLATSELFGKLILEFDKHPIALNPCSAYSPASLAKAYMNCLGVKPAFEKFADFSKEVSGIAMTAYYGGRAECHIRQTAVPVVHTDFVSMYTTVHTLMGLWEMETAETLEVETWTTEAQHLLDTATLDRYFDREAWRNLTWFGELEPNEDVLPVRAQYDSDHENRTLNIGVNVITSAYPSWWAGADLIADALLSGKVPRLKRALRIVPTGRQRGLKAVKFAGAIDLDPLSGDFFKSLIEERKRATNDVSLSPEDRQRISQALKIVASSGCYGICAEINRNTLAKDKIADIRVYANGSSFEAESNSPEEPGRYCFPPLAAFTTAGARLMLALLERSVTDRGGTFAFCDTDSMAIVATKKGGLVPCEGGPLRTRKGQPAIRALSWAQVDEIVKRFESLNPYDRSIVAGSVLEIKEVNHDENGKRSQLYVYAIAAKRYTFLRKKSGGRIEIIDPSEHGLGHLLDPLANEDNPKKWIERVWHYIVARALGLPVPNLEFLSVPALSRLSITSPQVLRPIAATQTELPFDERIHPTNFLLSASIAEYGHPAGADENHFHLVSQYHSDPKKALAEKWTDIHTGHQYDVTTDFPAPPYVARIRTFGSVLDRFVSHPEPKSAAADGSPSNRQTVGLLKRRHVSVGSIMYVGKETNRLEDVDNGLVHDWSEVYSVYKNPAHEAWRKQLPQLKKIPSRTLAAVAGISTRAIKAIRNGHSVPSLKTRGLLLKHFKNT